MRNILVRLSENMIRVAPYFLGALFLSSFVSANEIDWSMSEYDETLNLLKRMFGSVNNTLAGGVDGLTALQFKIFNISVMVFASMFVGTTIAQGVIATASQGVLMGKKQGQSSYFTLFRSSVGLFAVFPQYNGYSIIQVFVMSVVLKSVSLASQISTLILEKVMLDSPVEVFNEAQGIGGRAAAQRLSALSNREVADFYDAVFSSAVQSVQYNRAQPEFSRKAFAQSLYRIIPEGDDYAIVFDGVDNKILLYGYGNISIAFNDYIRSLVAPVVSKVFSCWPQGTPEDAGPRNCNRQEQRGSCGLTESQIATEIVRSINQNHPNFASSFVERIDLGSPDTVDLERGYLSNWVQFPFMYQAALDVKAAGLQLTNLEDLVKTAFPATTASAGMHELRKPTIPQTTVYTSLGGQKQDDIYPVIKQVTVDGMLSALSTQEFSSPLARVAPTVFSNTDKGTALEIVRGYLYQFERSVRSTPESSALTLNRQSLTDQADNFFADGSSIPTLANQWESFDPQGDYDQPLFSSFDAERVAMEKPVSAFIYHTGSNWIDTFIGSDNSGPKIIASPVTALVDLTTNMSRDTLLFVMTLIRNVAAEQIINAANTFWDFFGIQIGLTAASGTTSLLQRYFHDNMMCLSKNVVMGPGSSPSVNACNPMFFLPPYYNPGHTGQMIGVTIGLVISTAANVTANVANEVAASYFSYHYLLKSQFEYAYYTYILIAATPLMIISNLLAVWIPMLPSLVYFVAIVGWLFSVVEAMIASPLVLLGMTFPQGHDFLGSSQQALILLLSVFVRAPLIVIGFFMSMLFFYIAMSALGYAIIPMILNLFNFGTTDTSLGEAFMMFSFMLVVMYISGTLLSQTLSFTYKLPNVIVAWIGGQQMEGTEAAAVQQLQSVVNQQQQGALSSIQQAGVAGGRDQMSGQASGGFKSGKLGGN